LKTRGSLLLPRQVIKKYRRGLFFPAVFFFIVPIRRPGYRFALKRARDGLFFDFL
jgi:hypothetical protein